MFCRAEIGKPGDVALPKDLPKREGERPVIDPHPAFRTGRSPNAAIPKSANICVKGSLDSVVARHADVVMWGPSHVENGNDGVLLIKPEPGNPTIVRTRVWGEVGHIHPVDASLHLVLSPSDTKTVMDAGWGRVVPHGRPARAALTYTLIYAPRTKAEVDFAERYARSRDCVFELRGRAHGLSFPRH